jgi:hypothetical protein
MEYNIEDSTYRELTFVNDSMESSESDEEGIEEVIETLV